MDLLGTHGRRESRLKPCNLSQEWDRYGSRNTVRPAAVRKTKLDCPNQYIRTLPAGTAVCSKSATSSIMECLNWFYLFSRKFLRHLFLVTTWARVAITRGLAKTPANSQYRGLLEFLWV